MAVASGPWSAEGTGTTDARVRRTRAAVLAAARRVLLEDGWDAVTYRSVAAASSVGRATLYRHWPARADLLRDVIRREAELSHTTPVGDLRRELEALGRQLGAPALAAVVAVLFERSLHDPTLADIKAAVIHEVSRVVREILRRGIETGDLPPSLNHDRAVARLLGPLLYRRLATDRPVTRAVVVDVVGSFLAAAPPQPMPAGSGSARRG
ncbi:MAG: TetR/AcrR family transcriptional regulator [Actinomycetota bacterium]